MMWTTKRKTTVTCRKKKKMMNSRKKWIKKSKQISIMKMRSQSI